MVNEAIVVDLLKELAGERKWLQMRTRPEGSDPDVPSAFVSKRLIVNVSGDVTIAALKSQLQWIVDNATEVGGYLLCEGPSPLPFVEPEEGRHKWETPCVSVKSKKTRFDIQINLIHLRG